MISVPIHSGEQIMKSFIVCVILSAAIFANAQTKMYINKLAGGIDSVRVDSIKSISFKTFSNQYSFFFVDSFSTDLSKWTKYAGDCGGTWDIISGQLNANYSISCGSSVNSQSQLILNDAYQPNSANWKTTVSFKKATDPSFVNYSSVAAEFSIFLSAGQKLAMGLGTGGDNLPASVDSISISYGEWNGSQWQNQKSKTVGYKMSTTQSHKATLEKNGNIYKLYIDDVYLGSWTDTFINGQGKVGLHSYGPKTYDNFTIYR